MNLNTLVTQESKAGQGAGLTVTTLPSFDGTYVDGAILDEQGSVVVEFVIADAEMHALKSDLPNAEFC